MNIKFPPEYLNFDPCPHTSQIFILVEWLSHKYVRWLCATFKKTHFLSTSAFSLDNVIDCFLWVFHLTINERVTQIQFFSFEELGNFNWYALERCQAYGL